MKDFLIILKRLKNDVRGLSHKLNLQSVDDLWQIEMYLLYFNMQVK